MRFIIGFMVGLVDIGESDAKSPSPAGSTFVIGRNWHSQGRAAMANVEEIEKHVLRKYEICQKMGKGVSAAPYFCR